MCGGGGIPNIRFYYANVRLYYALGIFSAISSEIDNFGDFLFAFLNTVLLKRGLL